MTGAAERPGGAGPVASRPGWTIFILALCHAQAIATFQILNILIDPIKASLAISDTQYSLLQGLAVAIFAAILGIPAARMADRHSRRNVILLGAIGWSAATVSCTFVTTFPQLFVARVATGIGEVFLFPAAIALIADAVPPQRLSTALALFGCGGPAGGAAALFGGGWIVAHHDQISAWFSILAPLEPWRVAFLTCGLTGILTAFLLLSLREPGRERAIGGLGGMRDVAIFVTQRASVFVPVSLGMLCLAICAFATSAWVPTALVRAHGLGFDDAGRITGIAALVGGTALAWLAGRVTDWLHDRGWAEGVILASVGLSLALAGFLLLAALHSSSDVAILGWLAVYALLSAPTVLAATALQLISPQRMRAQIVAIHLLLVNAVALSLGPFAVAFLTDSIFHAPLAVGRSLAVVDIIAVVAALLLFLVARRGFKIMRSELS